MTSPSTVASKLGDFEELHVASNLVQKRMVLNMDSIQYHVLGDLEELHVTWNLGLKRVVLNMDSTTII